MCYTIVNRCILAINAETAAIATAVSVFCRIKHTALSPEGNYYGLAVIPAY